MATEGSPFVRQYQQLLFYLCLCKLYMQAQRNCIWMKIYYHSMSGYISSIQTVLLFCVQHGNVGRK